MYLKTKQEYQNFSKRKDGTDPFVHPLNVVYLLQKAKIKDYITLCAGLIHDLVEERVDEYKKKNNLKEEGKGIIILDEYESKMFLELEIELKDFCIINKIDLNKLSILMRVIKLLTRHKRDLYYRSISEIFSSAEKGVKERAIQIKLADRTHNIQCLNTFNRQQKMYQCFKNLFILNNVKNYLNLYNEEDKINKIEFNSTEKLFKKCSKATYDSFLQICHESLGQGVREVESMLQLAFKKFAYERRGLEKVTNPDNKEKHPLGLYHGILLKYDARLHQEWVQFENTKENEKLYFARFFSDFNFNDEQLQAIIDYKDAYALKEVISRILYKKNYAIAGFGCANLCRRGMKCMRC